MVCYNAVSYTHLDVYKRQGASLRSAVLHICTLLAKTIENLSLRNIRDYYMWITVWCLVLVNTPLHISGVEQVVSLLASGLSQVSGVELLNSRILMGLTAVSYTHLIIKGWFEQVRPESSRYTEWDTEIFPEGLYEGIQQVWNKYHLPIYITENGIGLYEDTSVNQVEDDDRRCV